MKVTIKKIDIIFFKPNFEEKYPWATIPKKAPILKTVPEYIPNSKDKPNSVTILGIQLIKKYKQAKEKKKAVHNLIVESICFAWNKLFTGILLARLTLFGKESIFEMDNFRAAKPNVEYAHNMSLKYTIPGGFDKFNKLIEKIYEN